MQAEQHLAGCRWEAGADASIRSNISLVANVSAGSQGGLRALGICRQGSISRNAGGEAGAAARWVRTRTRAGHSLGVTDRAAACLGAMIGKKQSGGLVGSSGMAAFVIMERKYRLRYFRNINKSTLRNACHAWQAWVQRNLRFRFARFCQNNQGADGKRETQKTGWRGNFGVEQDT